MIVSISTIKPRVQLCMSVIRQMHSQAATKIFLHCDGFKPDGKLRKLVDEFTWSPKPKGTTQRLKWAAKFDDSEIIAVVDDDITYPPDYLERGLRDLKKYGDVIAYHGRVYRPSGRLAMAGLHFTKAVKSPVTIAMPGCGVMFTRAEVLKSAYQRADRKKFAFRCDMLLAVACWCNKWKIVRSPSIEGWLKPVRTNGPTIWRTKKKENMLAIIYAKSLGWPN